MNSFLFSFPLHTSLLLLTICSRKIGIYSMKSLLSLHQKEDFFCESALPRRCHSFQMRWWDSELMLLFCRRGNGDLSGSCALSGYSAFQKGGYAFWSFLYRSEWSVHSRYVYRWIGCFFTHRYDLFRVECLFASRYNECIAARRSALPDATLGYFDRRFPYSFGRRREISGHCP